MHPVLRLYAAKHLSKTGKDLGGGSGAQHTRLSSKRQSDAVTKNGAHRAHACAHSLLIPDTLIVLQDPPESRATDPRACVKEMAAPISE